VTSENLSFNWKSEVRDYEIDFQGIVNNACYFQYMAHTRALHFLKLGIDLVKIAQEEIKGVLIESHTKFLNSLKYKDVYHVTSELTRISRFKLLFNQKIIESNSNKICVIAQNICCILDTNNKPFFPDMLNHLPIVKNSVNPKIGTKI